jgi:hypothetical protein
MWLLVTTWFFFQGGCMYDDTIRACDFLPNTTNIKSCWPHAERRNPDNLRVRKIEESNKIKYTPSLPSFWYSIVDERMYKKSPFWVFGLLWNALALPCWHSSKAISFLFCFGSFSPTYIRCALAFLERYIFRGPPALYSRLSAAPKHKRKNSFHTYIDPG